MAEEDDSKQVGQNEIEELLKQAQASKAPSEQPAPAESTESEDDSTVNQDEVEALLAQKAKPAAAPAETAEDDDADKVMGQNDIEALLNKTVAKQAPAKPPAKPAAAAASSGSGPAPQDVELLLNQAEEALASIDAPASPAAGPTSATPFHLREFSGAPPTPEATTLGLIRDVELNLRIELGRTHMYLEDVLHLRKGSVVPLDKLAGDPVDIYVNGRLIARGEVLVLNDNFCVRVAELIAGKSAAAS